MEETVDFLKERHEVEIKEKEEGHREEIETLQLGVLARER